MKCNIENWCGWPVLCSTSSKNVILLTMKWFFKPSNFEVVGILCCYITCKWVILSRSVSFLFSRYSFGSWKQTTINNKRGWTPEDINLQLQGWPCKRHNLCFWMWTNQWFCWCSSAVMLVAECPVAPFRVGWETTRLKVTRLLKKLCINMANKQWTWGEDFQEFVMNGICKSVSLCCFGCLCRVRIQYLLIPRLQKRLGRKCVLSQQMEQAESL